VLAALDGMDERGASPSPYVSELDLYVTTTDLEGLPLPLRLADGAVEERRFRNVFHFVYAQKEATGGERNDFTKVNNPFLAFAARCTSSFPFAFEPMTLEDIVPFAPFGDRPFERQVEKWRGRSTRVRWPAFPARSFMTAAISTTSRSATPPTLLRRRADLRTRRMSSTSSRRPIAPDACGRRRGPAARSHRQRLKALFTIPAPRPSATTRSACATATARSSAKPSPRRQRHRGAPPRVKSGARGAALRQPDLRHDPHRAPATAATTA
jgi:hypothetical protein